MSNLVMHEIDNEKSSALDKFIIHDEKPVLIGRNSYHMGCLFLIDTSAAMLGEIINETTSIINQFVADIKKNRILCDIYDIAVVEYNSCAHVVQEFMPADHLEPVDFCPFGVSNLDSGLKKSVEMIHNRNWDYHKNGEQPGKTWLIVITDDGCASAPYNEIIKEIDELEKRGIVQLLLLGTKNSGSELMREIDSSRISHALNQIDLIKLLYMSVVPTGENHCFRKDESGD